MELTDDFRVAMPVEQVWDLLPDLGRVASWIPGAVVEDVEGEVHRGSITVKVGPVTTCFRGTAEVTRADPVARRAVITATGSDADEDGHAPSVVVLTVVVRPVRDGAQVDLHARIDIKGRLARFGDGVVRDVSGRMLQQFVADMRADLGLRPPPRPLPEDALPPLPPEEAAEAAEVFEPLPAGTVTGDPWASPRRLPEPSWDAPPRLEDRFDLPDPDPEPLEPVEGESVTAAPEVEVGEIEENEEPAAGDEPESESEPAPAPDATSPSGPPAPQGAGQRWLEQDPIAPVRPRGGDGTGPVRFAGERTSADVLAGPDPALAGRVAPLALFVMILWLLRRMLGSGNP